MTRLSRLLLFSIFYLLFSQYALAQLAFVENQGQVHDQYGSEREDVLYSAQYTGLTFHFLKNSMHYQIDRLENDTTHIYRLDMKWVDATSRVQVYGKEKANSYINFYSENKEINGIETFSRLHYSELYDKIDLTFYSKGNQLKYDYIVKAGGDVGNIKWKIDGASRIRIDDEGNLNIETPFGTIQEEKPIAFCGNEEVGIQWHYSKGILSLLVEDYDQNADLIIDPKVGLLDWATYYGGSGNEMLYDVSIDPSGNVYTCGYTQSSASIATTGSHQTSMGGSRDGFITKFDSTGTRLWSTYYGGSLNDEIFSCAVKGSADLFIAGYTFSTSGIATSGGHQDSIGGMNDAFIARFNSSGVRSWATYYGGSASDFFTSVSVGDSNFIYAVGNTLSPDNIATPGAHSDSSNGAADGFIVKFTDTGSRIWGTYVGGVFLEYMNSCDALGSSVLMVSGYTESSNGIGTPGTHQPTKAGFADAFVMKFNSNGTRLWGTYFGGSDEEVSNNSRMDADGNVYFVGYTRSTSGIATTGAFQTSHGGGADDGYIAKLNTNGLLDWATYYGGVGADILTGVSIEGQKFYAFGNTASISNIATTGSHQVSHGGNLDAFLVKMDTSGTREWATYYGGIGVENSGRCMSTGNGKVYLIGQSSSSSSIATTGSHQSSLGGSYDGFLAKFYEECLNDSTYATDTVCDSYTSPSGKYMWTSSGLYSDTLQNMLGCDSIIYIDLTINESSTQNVDMSSCNDSVFISPSGKFTWTSPGLYADSLVSSKGCDSILNINLDFVAVDTTLTLIGDTLYSNELSGDNYYWDLCPQNLGLLGTGRKLFEPALINGQSYQVLIVKSNCHVYSECFLVNGVGIDEIIDDNILIFPNPNNGTFFIELKKLTEATAVEVFTSKGNQVYNIDNLKQKRVKVTLSNDGIYFLRITTSSGVLNEKIIVKD